MMLKYTNDELNTAVKRVLAGETRRAVSNDAQIAYRTLKKWVANAKIGVFRSPVRRGPAPMLPASAEKSLVEWIIGLQFVGHPVDRREIIYKAGTMSAMITGQAVGAGWYRRFMGRHPTLAPRISQPLTKARACVTHEDSTRLFTSLVKAVVENSMDASRIFNMDETAFQSSKGSKRVVAVRESRNVWHQDVSVNFHLSLVTCDSAAGVMVPPMFVLPGFTVKLDVLNGCGLPGAAVTTSSSGFMNSDLFVEWLLFPAKSVPTPIKRPILLIMDGCSSHYSMKIVLEAERLGVLLLLLPSNATHILQPLDVAVFSSLKAQLRRQTEVYLGETGRKSIDKEQEIKMASTAWQTSNMDTNVKAGFVRCAIYPLSKPHMDSCVANFHRNGMPDTTHLAAWLRIKEVVQKEVLVLPPSRKRVLKTATVAGRLLTREALNELATPPKVLKKIKTRRKANKAVAVVHKGATGQEKAAPGDIVLEATV